jgi:hypothetical protein
VVYGRSTEQRAALRHVTSARFHGLASSQHSLVDGYHVRRAFWLHPSKLEGECLRWVIFDDFRSGLLVG